MFLLFLYCFWFVAIVNADFSEDCLVAHNKYRKIHHAPDLVLDGDINAGAQAWADNLAATGQFRHSSPSDRSNLGENLYYSMGRKLRASSAVDSWYNEIEDYSFRWPGYSSETGHFTQVVWKSSEKLGCAYGQKGRKIFVVARYSPAGNILGQFEENVLQSGNIIKSSFFIIINLFISLLFFF